MARLKPAATDATTFRGRVCVVEMFGVGCGGIWVAGNCGPKVPSTVTFASAKIAIPVLAEAVMATSARVSETQREVPQDSTERKEQRFATAFGELTREEIHDWEKMLGRRLLRLPQEPGH
jgi:hypothetical protein